MKQLSLPNLACVAALGLFLGAVEQVQATIVLTSVVWSGPSDGDNMSISFTPFFANSLTSITGGGYAHNHSLSAIFGIDLHINGAWTTVHTWTQDSGDHLLSEQTSGGPITFAGGTVDGIRLTDSPVVGNGYHGMYGSYLASGTTTFNFDTITTAPEPGTLTLLGIGACGMLGYRCRRRKALVG